MQCHDVLLTLISCCINIICPLGVKALYSQLHSGSVILRKSDRNSVTWLRSHDQIYDDGKQWHSLGCFFSVFPARTSRCLQTLLFLHDRRWKFISLTLFAYDLEPLTMELDGTLSICISVLLPVYGHLHLYFASIWLVSIFIMDLTLEKSVHFCTNYFLGRSKQDTYFFRKAFVPLILLQVKIICLSVVNRYNWSIRTIHVRRWWTDIIDQYVQYMY